MNYRDAINWIVLNILPAYNRGRLQPTRVNIALEKLIFYSHYSIWPDFRNPSSYFELVNREKFYGDYEKLAQISNKLAVRDYVKEKIGGHYLNSVIDVADSPGSIDKARYLSYPKRFVAKPNMASKRVFINETVDYERFQRETAGFMEEFGNRNNEFHYKHIPKKLIIEEWIQPSNGELIELKCLHFNGRLELIARAVNVYENEKSGASSLRFYDRNWKEPRIQIREHLAGPTPKPAQLEELIDRSETLARGWPFMRVDWYLADNKLIFGEMTPTPKGGRSFNLNLEDHRFMYENYYKNQK
ncbi:MAG: hypothetical protein EA391_01620 [Balneolaceae bacterium]|nr:MAG: hypothetical protein EA391_01620 [Balneolaceae bacterium]